MKKIYFVLCAVFIITLSSCGGAPGSAESTSSSPDKQVDLGQDHNMAQSIQESASEEMVASDLEETKQYYFKDNVLVSEDVRIEITDYKVLMPGQAGNEYGSKPVIAFWYNTTNLTGNESVSAMAAWIAMFRAYQDTDPNLVNELTVAALPDAAFLETQTEIIKKDGTVQNAMAYNLDSETVPVVLKATRGIDGEPLGEQTFEIDDLTSPDAAEPFAETPSPTAKAAEKEFLPPVEGYEEAPEIIFSTTGTENGLADTPMYIDAAFTDVRNLDGHDIFIITSASGSIALGKNTLLNAVFPIADESVLRYYFLYQGWSDVLEMPVGVYVGWKGSYSFEGTDVMPVEDLLNLFGIGQEASAPTLPESTATLAPTPTPNSSKCSLEEYNQIEIGMSYDEVIDIIGSEGGEMSTATIAGNTATVYQWDGDKKCSNVVIEFMNDAVISKAQAGLD